MTKLQIKDTDGYIKENNVQNASANMFIAWLREYKVRVWLAELDRWSAWS